MKTLDWLLKIFSELYNLTSKFHNTISLLETDLCSVVKMNSQEKFWVMKSNEVLQKNVQEAMKWELLLNAAEICVTVVDGVVTLNGMVDSYAKKLEVEDTAKNVFHWECYLVSLLKK